MTKQDIETLGRKELVCACNNVSVEAFLHHIAENPGVAFDRCLAETDVGTKCTACLMDAEHYFVNAVSADVKSVGAKTPRGSTRGAPIGLGGIKRHIWSIVDSVSPKVTIPLRGLMPVLLGPGIEQTMIVSNQALLFENKEEISGCDVDWELRDEAGMLVFRGSRYVEVGDTLRVSLTEPFADRIANINAGELAAGSVEVFRRSRSIGVRGTTRPQIEILTAKSACSVHAQDYGFRAGNAVDCFYRPDEERILLTFLNRQRDPIRIEVSSESLSGEADDGLGVQPHVVSVPAGGARLVNVSDIETARLRSIGLSAPNSVDSSGLRRIIWRGKGIYRAHILFASPSYDRFSIDHV